MQSAESPRARLIAAAKSALLDSDAAGLLSTVGVREIARRSGLSTSSVYHHFGSLNGLAQAVLDDVYDPGPEPTATTVDSMIDLTAEKFPLEPSLQLHASELARIVGDPEFPLRTGLWAFGGEPAAEAYRHYLRTINARLTAFLEVLYQQWGREARPPFDVAGIMNALDAFVNGTALRELVDPNPARVEQYPRACVAMSTTLLRVYGDRHDTDDRLAELNHYPLDRRSVTSTARHEATRSRILQSAGELFRLQGYAATTIAQIARRADVTPTTIHSLYATKSGVAGAVFRAQAHTALPWPEPAEHGDRLRAHLSEVADFAGARRGFLAPYASALLTDETSEQMDPIVERTVDLIAELGVQNAEDAARTLLVVLMQRLLHDPSATPDDVAALTLALLGPTLLLAHPDGETVESAH